jgi:hypothetical protein
MRAAQSSLYLRSVLHTWSEAMVREFATAMVLGAVLTGAAAGQQSVGVSAVILERVEADAVEVEVRSIGGRLRVEHPESPVQQVGTRLLRSTYVNPGVGAGAAETTVPVRVHEGGTLRLERRAVQAGGESGEKVPAGGSVLIDAVDQLTLTRVVASNS